VLTLSACNEPRSLQTKVATPPLKLLWLSNVKDTF